MQNHAIALTSCGWVEAAASGKVKVLDFPKRRKKGIRSLGPGSVVLVACRREGIGAVITGELVVKEVRKLYSGTYRRLARKGLIHEPQELKPREYVWAIMFEEFIKYPREVPQSELSDVKTSTSHKPISDWLLIGLTYIKSGDSHVIDKVRSKAGVLSYLMKKLRELEIRLNQIQESLKK